MSYQPLRIGEIEEPSLQASKWLQIQMLIDSHEMENLFHALGDFHIFLAGAICLAGTEEISKENFLQTYARYIELLKNATIPEEREFRAYFSAVFTLHRDHLFQRPVSNGKSLIRVAKPCIQLQLNRIAYSEADGKFRPMVFGQESFLWGIQFSYPQLYQEPLSKEIFSVKDGTQFPNTGLFRKLHRWCREETVPTPFQVGLKKTNTPMRLGKACFAWIAAHRQLTEKGIGISALPHLN